MDPRVFTGVWYIVTYVECVRYGVDIRHPDADILCFSCGVVSV